MFVTDRRAFVVFYKRFSPSFYIQILSKTLLFPVLCNWTRKTTATTFLLYSLMKYFARSSKSKNGSEIFKLFFFSEGGCDFSSKCFMFPNIAFWHALSRFLLFSSHCVVFKYIHCNSTPSQLFCNTSVYSGVCSH